MRQTIILFSMIILSCMLLLFLSKYALQIGFYKTEWIVGGIALLFFTAGFLLKKKSTERHQVADVSAIDFLKIKELRISDREYDVLLQLSEQKTNKEIAAALFISESTVKKHVSRLMQKLAASSRTEVIVLAHQFHILPSSPQ